MVNWKDDRELFFKPLPQETLSYMWKRGNLGRFLTKGTYELSAHEIAELLLSEELSIESIEYGQEWTDLIESKYTSEMYGTEFSIEGEGENEGEYEGENEEGEEGEAEGEGEGEIEEKLEKN